MDKASLRLEVRRRLAALPPARRALEEELVTAAVQATPEWAQAGAVLLYRSVAPELSTVGLVNAAWRSGKRTLFPVVEGDHLGLRSTSGWTGFRPGWRGIPEAAGPVVAPQEAELAIVPGVAFTPDGRRLGRGGGHYDRLLPRLRCPAWGVAFACQVVPDVPTEGHDRRVDRLFHGGTVDDRPTSEP